MAAITVCKNALISMDFLIISILAILKLVNC